MYLHRSAHPSYEGVEKPSPRLKPYYANAIHTCYSPERAFSYVHNTHTMGTVPKPETQPYMACGLVEDPGGDVRHSRP